MRINVGVEVVMSMEVDDKHPRYIDSWEVHEYVSERVMEFIQNKLEGFDDDVRLEDIDFIRSEEG